jgi:small subunit ribosomal protein S2
MGPDSISYRHVIYIIDLTQTMGMLSTALDIIQKTVAKGGKILFVATKKTGVSTSG